MPRKRSRTMTEAEQRLMDVLWDKGEATVGEISEALPKRLGLAYNTVLTTMRILEEKGYVSHTKPDQRRAFIYHPRVARTVARRRAVREILRRFFDHSHEALVLSILQDEDIDERKRKRIRELLVQFDRELKP